jgi:hypothetical protein
MVRIRFRKTGVSVRQGPANCVCECMRSVSAEGMPCFALACIWNSRRCRPSSAREAAGTVEAVGEGVTGVAIGDKVSTMPVCVPEILSGFIATLQP